MAVPVDPLESPVRDAVAETDLNGLPIVFDEDVLVGLPPVTDEGKRAVAFCHPQRWGSRIAAKRLTELGYSRVCWYPGGSVGWTAHPPAAAAGHGVLPNDPGKADPIATRGRIPSPATA